MSYTENVILNEGAAVANAATECFACCESFNKSTHALVNCDGCNFPICKGCVRTYLTSTASDPHCMNCKKGWSQKFIVANLNQTWVSKDYKEHRKKFLTDQQIAKLPESMAAAAKVGDHGMLSVVGLADDALQECCAEARAKLGGDCVCVVANYLFPQGRVAGSSIRLLITPPHVRPPSLGFFFFFHPFPNQLKKHSIYLCCYAPQVEWIRV